MCLQIATNSERLCQPMLVYAGFAQRPDKHPALSRESLQHRIGFTDMTRVELVGPYAEDLSVELELVADSDVITCRKAEHHWLELGFDGEKQGKRFDFRPGLPLIFHW